MTFTDFEKALGNTNQIELTTTDRVSGRESARPVWFVRQGETLYLLPVGGSDSQWYKNVLRRPRSDWLPAEPNTAHEPRPLRIPTYARCSESLGSCVGKGVTVE